MQEVLMQNVTISYVKFQILFHMFNILIYLVQMSEIKTDYNCGFLGCDIMYVVWQALTTTWHHISEDSSLNIHCHENLKFHT
jgi:hypothetical protein